MIVLICLFVFAVVGFSPVDTIPGATPNRISRSKFSPEEQIIIDETCGINLPISRLPNSCTFTGDISTQNAATSNGDSNPPSKASPSLSAVAADQARSQSNRLLFQERQACFTVCGKATVSPYDTFCCEEGQYCTTINGTPLCSWSTPADSQGFSSTSSTSTHITPIPASQTIDSSFATEGPSSISEVLSTTASAFPTQLSTRQSSSTGSSQSASSPPSSSVTSSSSTSVTSSSSTSSSSTSSSSTSVTSSSSSSSTSSNPSTTTTSSPSPALSTPTEDNGFSPGAITGIVIGAVVTLIASWFTRKEILYIFSLGRYGQWGSMRTSHLRGNHP